MQEIIDIIHKTIYQFFDVCGDNEEMPLTDKDKLLLSVNKAICNNLKALEQESSGDLISREAVLNTLNKHWLNGTVARRIVDELGDSIKELPSVNPQPKVGHWIKIYLTDTGDIDRMQITR